MLEKNYFFMGFSFTSIIMIVIFILFNTSFLEKVRIYENKDEAYESINKYIIDDVYYNTNHYFNCVGSNEELDTEILKQAIEKNSSPPFKMKPVEMIKYIKVKRIKHFIGKTPLYTESDLYMQELIIELIASYDLINEMYSYYENNEYEQDDFAAAKELHQELIYKINKLSDLLEKFNLAYHKEYNEKIIRCLEEYKSNGHLSNYYAYRCLNSANEIRRYMIEKGFSPERNDYILGFDEEEFSNLCKAFRTACKEYERYINDSESIKSESNFVFISSPELSQSLQNMEDILPLIPEITVEHEMYESNRKSAIDDMFFDYYELAVSEYYKIFE